MKTCSRCKVLKGKSSFSKNKTAKDGLQHNCKPCNRSSGKKWYANNRVRACDTSRKSYQNNREKVNARSKKWWAKHPEAATIKWRKYYQNNPEKVKLKNKKFQAENPTYNRTAALKRNYGITPKDFDLMSREQGGVCAVCKLVPGGKGFYIDHNHETGRVRGLLCFTCNMALGLLKDSAVFARSAAEYLERTL